MAISALSIGASGFRSGIDGNWSTFPVQIGSDSPQQVDTFVSTNANTQLVVVAEGCSSSDCARLRGGIFYPGQSASWSTVSENSGFFFVPTDMNLLAPVRAQYGFDYVGLGYPGYGGQAIGKNIVGGIQSTQFYLGLLGILARPFQFGNIPGSHPSVIESLRAQNKIPSLTWGYTAGAKYQLQDTGPLGSLTLGGYDKSKFTPNDVSFPMNSDVSNYLTVGIQSIQVDMGNGQPAEMLSQGIYASLDSTLPYLWLPKDACQKFEDQFGLTWDPTYELYYVSTKVRDKIVGSDPIPTITFTLGPKTSGGDTVAIKLPYLSFDLMAVPPLIPQPQYYFPLKRAANSSQYTLGRTFFQEAYVIADFDRNNFSVSQCVFATGSTSEITNILPPGSGPAGVTVTHEHNSGSSAPAGLIAGVVVAVVVIVAVALLGFWFWRRRKRRAAQGDEKAPPYSAHVAELDGYSKPPKTEKTKNELEATESGRATPVGYESGRATPVGYERGTVPNIGSSPLGSPRTWGSQSPPVGSPRSPLSEMDGNQYFELPGSVSAMHASSTTEVRSNTAADSGPQIVSPVPRHPSPPAQEDTINTAASPSPPADELTVNPLSQVSVVNNVATEQTTTTTTTTTATTTTTTTT